MRILFYLLAIFFTLSNVLLSQVDDVYTGTPTEKNQEGKKENKRQKSEMEEPLSRRLIYSGNFSINYWNGWYIFLNPRIGIKTDKKNVFIPGAGLVYLYWGNRISGSFYLYGPMTYAMINVLPSFYLAGEFYYINQQDFRSSFNPFRRIWIPYTYVGGGYRSRITDGLSTNLSILFNITPHRSSVFSNPFFQVGVIYGL
jgi:hypothetical protein